MFKYVFKPYPKELAIYKKLLWVALAVIVITALISANALSFLLFFGAGWYAQKEYAKRQPKKRKPRKPKAWFDFSKRKCYTSVMKYLPDSAIVGTYKRMRRKPKATYKSRAQYQKEADFWNAIANAVLGFAKTKTKW